MTLDQAEYERYLRDIGGEDRSADRFTDTETEKMSFRPEYGVVAPPGAYEQQKANDLSFDAYIKDMQRQIAESQAGIEKYTADQTAALEHYKSPGATDYKAWLDPISDYYRAENVYDMYQQKVVKLSDFKNTPAPFQTVEASPTVYQLPKSLGDALVAMGPQEQSSIWSGLAVAEAQLKKQWTLAQQEQYQPGYEAMLSEINKVQGDVSLAQEKMQGDIDIHQATLDEMRKRYADGVKRRTDSLASLRVGSTNTGGSV